MFQTSLCNTIVDDPVRGTDVGVVDKMLDYLATDTLMFRDEVSLSIPYTRYIIGTTYT